MAEPNEQPDSLELAAALRPFLEVYLGNSYEGAPGIYVETYVANEHREACDKACRLLGLLEPQPESTTLDGFGGGGLNSPGRKDAAEGGCPTNPLLPKPIDGLGRLSFELGYKVKASHAEGDVRVLDRVDLLEFSVAPLDARGPDSADTYGKATSRELLRPIRGEEEPPR